jgi:pyrroline-5-carboxylate reductase
LLLLDGHSLAYRAFFALPVENFSTTTGQPTNAVYGFTSMLINVLRDEAPTHVAVAFDVSRQTFRNEMFPAYKANRTSSPDDFKGQVALIKEVLNALRIPSVEKEGFEADDVIATIATQAEANGVDVLICTGDRDTFQLVNEHVTVLYPKRGVSDLTRMTPGAVQDRYGLTPVQYPDFAALRGDPSDNLPNIPSVGEKTAAKWVVQFGSLDQLVARADEVKGKAGDALRAHLGQIMTNRRVTELVRDVPLEVRTDDLARQPWDPLIVSVAAGVPPRVLSSMLMGRTRVVWAMPNTPAAVGRAVTGLYADPEVTQEERAMAERLFATVGIALWVDDENMMAALTAVSGCGPAYVYCLIESLEAAALKFGFEPAAAARVAVHTFAGAVTLLERRGAPPAELRAEVTTREGITEQAIHTLQAAGCSDALLRSAECARVCALALAEQLTPMVDHRVTAGGA